MSNAALDNIAKILDEHFNPPKKTDWKMIITYLVTGALTIGMMYLLYKILQPLYNYNL